MTTTTISTTPVPVRTEGQSWDAFVEAIIAADGDEGTRLLQEFPTPKITAENGTPEWRQQYDSQVAASQTRDAAQQKFQARLIVAVAEAVEAAVVGFQELTIEYCGSGDSGEIGYISVSVGCVGEATIPHSHFPTRLLYSQEQQDERARNQETADGLLTEALKEWLDETAWSIAYSNFPGFEIDAGGFGTITAARDKETGKMTLELSHTQRVEENYSPVELV